MKVFVVGNCQAAVLVRCLAAMAPALEVVRLPENTDARVLAADDDVIIVQRSVDYENSIRPPAPNEFHFPYIHFAAFHPDLVYVGRRSGGLVQTPLTDYHSAIALWGWQHGLSAADTARLYCEEVFEKLHFFRYWDIAKKAMLDDGAAAGIPFDAMFARWQRSGIFMHSVNHPRLIVMAEIARVLARRARLPLMLEAAEDVMQDPMLDHVVYPVYPEIAARLGVPGSRGFKMPNPPGVMPTLLALQDFIALSFESYESVPAGDIYCERLETAAYRELDPASVDALKRPSSNGVVVDLSRPVEPPRPEGPSPYASLPDFQFWRRAIENVDPGDVDPVALAPFTIDTAARVATAGSCFAQHVSRTLQRNGYNFYVTERGDGTGGAPSGDGAVYSARYGNVYTARQLVQLFDRAYGSFEPNDVVWTRKDGRFVDPFRPAIEPDGFATVDEMLASRATHLAAVRTMFENLDVFVFTLGLTETWRAKCDGAVFPVAPGVAGGEADLARYEFVNFTTAEVINDLEEFLGRLRLVNPGANTVLTVSPVPLIATYEQRHVLVSTTYSKSALRAAVDAIERSHPNVWYFPSYEIVTGAFNRGAYFEDDLRSVRAEGVEHVMRLFMEHCTPVDGEPAAADESASLLEEIRDNMDVICDEALLDKLDLTPVK